MAENKPRNIHRTFRIVIDQHSNAIRQLADTFGLRHARDSMCGFIALAVVVMVVHDNDCSSTEEAKNMRETLEKHILPWIVHRRETYVREHGDEFVPNNASYKDSNGRMSVAVYQAMMPSTTELAEFLSQERLQETSNIALLRNVLEGPVVDETSIRFPRGSSFISQEEQQYIEQERPFWGNDYYVQLCGAAGKKFVSLSEWCKAVVAEGTTEWKIIIDSHGHYHVLRIAFDTDENKMHLEELDSMQRDDDYRSQPCENLVRVLESEWQEKNRAM